MKTYSNVNTISSDVNRWIWMAWLENEVNEVNSLEMMCKNKCNAQSSNPGVCISLLKLCSCNFNVPTLADSIIFSYTDSADILRNLLCF